MSRMLPPAKRPCGSCPYRRDVPSGVWAPEEYLKLPLFDLPTGEQPASVFVCHQQDGHLCAGWAGCHDMSESLGLRFALVTRDIDVATYEATRNYSTDTPLWGSGKEAMLHGLTDLADPTPLAQQVIAKLERRQKKAAQ